MEYMKHKTFFTAGLILMLSRVFAQTDNCQLSIPDIKSQSTCSKEYVEAFQLETIPSNIEKLQLHWFNKNDLSTPIYIGESYMPEVNDSVFYYEYCARFYNEELNCYGPVKEFNLKFFDYNLITTFDACYGDIVSIFDANPNLPKDGLILGYGLTGHDVLTGKLPPVSDTYDYYYSYDRENCKSTVDFTVNVTYVEPPFTEDILIMQDTAKMLTPPPLSAYGDEGACIKWYTLEDTQLKELEDNDCDGEFYSPERYEGIYEYLATQEINGCESHPKNAILYIMYCPIPPLETENLIICEESTSIELSAVPQSSSKFTLDGDEIIHWYDNPDADPIYSGGTFSPPINDLKKEYYAKLFDPIEYCYSPPSQINVSYADISNSVDSIQNFCDYDEHFILKANDDANYNWFTTSEMTENSLFASGYEAEAPDMLVGKYTYWVQNECGDSKKITSTIGIAPDSRIKMDTIAFQGRKELYRILPMYPNQENTTFSFEDLRIGLNPVTNTGLDYPILSYSADNSGTDTIAMTASNEYCTSTTVQPFHVVPAPSVKFTVESDKTNGAVTFNNESVLELFEEFENEIDAYYLEYSFSDEIDTVDFSEPFTKIFPPGEWEVTLTAVTTMGDKRSYIQTVSSEGGPVLTNIESLLPTTTVSLYTIDGKLIKQNIPFNDISKECEQGIYVVKPARDSGEGQIIYIK